jgi:hypothetical protein
MIGRSVSPIAWTKTRGSDIDGRGMRASSAGLLSSISGRGRAVRLACFFSILRVASLLANWN